MSNQKTEQKTKAKGNVSNIIDCDKVNANKLTFTELDTKNERSAGQSICYPNYEYLPNIKKNFIVRTQPIKLVQYGIPLMNEKTKKWIKSDKDREYIRIPYNPEDPNSVSFFNMLEEIDKRTLELQPTIFGTKSSQYKYIPLVKEPSEFEENEDDTQEHQVRNKQPTEPRMKFCKVKIDTDYNDDRRVVTAVFADGNKDPVPDIKTISDMAEYVTWQSTVKFIIMVNKLWAEKTKLKGTKKEFGITMKCLQLEITEKATKMGSVKNSFRKAYAFNQDVEQNVEQEVESGKDVNTSHNEVRQETPKVEKKTAKRVEEQEEVEEEGDEDVVQDVEETEEPEREPEPEPELVEPVEPPKKDTKSKSNKVSAKETKEVKEVKETKGVRTKKQNN